MTEQAIANWKYSPMRWFMGAFGGGLAGGSIYLMFKLYASDREVALQVIDSVPLFVIIVLLITVGGPMLDDRFRRVIEAMQEGSRAQQKLADNVGTLVMKDDIRAREQDILLNHLARTSETILGEVRKFRCEAQQ